MKSWRSISFSGRSTRQGGPFWVALFALACLAFVVALFSIPGYAKDPSVTAIILFDGPHGASYVQATDITLNGKIEVRTCEGVTKLDKNVYNGLPRTTLLAATSLQRTSKGVLTLTANGKSVCVVPANLKFEHSVELTLTEAADQAMLHATPVLAMPRDAEIPAFKPGMQLVFVATPDVELADFLRAQRANTINDWQDFLTRHPSSSRRSSAEVAVAGFHQQAAEAALVEFKNAKAPDLAMLKLAYIEAQSASQASPGYKPAAQFVDAIDQQLDTLAKIDQTRLQSYRKAVQDHTAGYSQLSAARQHVAQLLDVHPDYAPLVSLQRDLNAEQKKLDKTIVGAQVQMVEGHFDQAVDSLGPYVAFASEMPRIDGVVSAAFKYHFETGQKLAARQEFEKAIAEFTKAGAIKPDRKDVQAAIDSANAQLDAQRDQQAADAALAQSNDYAQKNQFVEAYNVLADLPEKQRALVSEKLAALSHDYVAAAVKRAQKLQETHVPIKNAADANAALEAYVLWDRASTLADDPAITVKRDFLAGKISAYSLDLANRYLQKPDGSGTGLGFLYLKQAAHYGLTESDSLKDEMTRYEPIYQRKSRLTVAVVVHDQTSRHDTRAFADQVSEAMSRALESSGLPLSVVRNSEADAAQPSDFALTAEIFDHHVVKKANLESPESKYRAGTHDVKTDVWLQIENYFEAAQKQLDVAQKQLADDQNERKKKQIIAADNDAVQQAQKNVDDLRHKLDTTEQNRSETVIATYHYTKKTIDLTASAKIEFQFRDHAGNPVGDPVDVHRDKHSTTVLLQDVKPEDTEGVTNQGVEPDQAPFLADLEADIRNAAVKAIKDKTAELPMDVLQSARALAQKGDNDGAAEFYVMYLNATPQLGTPERMEAVKFLRDQFNLALAVDSKL